MTCYNIIDEKYINKKMLIILSYGKPNEEEKNRN